MNRQTKASNAYRVRDWIRSARSFVRAVLNTINSMRTEDRFVVEAIVRRQERFSCVFASHVLLFAVKRIRVHLQCCSVFATTCVWLVDRYLPHHHMFVVLRRCVLARFANYIMLFTAFFFSARFFAASSYNTYGPSERMCGVQLCMRVEQTVSRVLEFRISVNRPTCNYFFSLACWPRQKTYGRQSRTKIKRKSFSMPKID